MQCFSARLNTERLYHSVDNPSEKLFATKNKCHQNLIGSRLSTSNWGQGSHGTQTSVYGHIVSLATLRLTFIKRYSVEIGIVVRIDVFWLEVCSNVRHLH